MPLNNFTYTLSWSDFTQLPSRPSSNDEDAQIHPEISFSKFKLAKKGRGVTISDVDVDIHLVLNDCWVVSAQMSNDLLKHEQGHYDILAISAREIYNELLKTSAANTNDLQVKVKEVHKKMAQLSSQVNNRYDSKSETFNSRNTAKQTAWNKAIATEKQKPDGSLINL